MHTCSYNIIYYYSFPVKANSGDGHRVTTARDVQRAAVVCEETAANKCQPGANSWLAVIPEVLPSRCLYSIFAVTHAPEKVYLCQQTAANIFLRWPRAPGLTVNDSVELEVILQSIVSEPKYVIL